MTMDNKYDRKTEIQRTQEAKELEPYANCGGSAYGASEGLEGELHERGLGTGLERPDVALFSGQEIPGGMLTQLIKTEQDRLGEAEECIARYQREVEKSKARLEELTALQRLEQEQNTDGQ